MLGFFLCLLLAVPPPVFHASFDITDHGWAAVRGVATTDAQVLHANHQSLRVEAGGGAVDACVRSAEVPLTIGKRYELSGWVRTEDLRVRDLDRSPIATGAALTMASMPFDVHSASVAGSQDWTRLRLRFIASRTRDSILITVANGGAFSGRAWFEGVSIDEASSQDEWPAREAVQTFGPAYRYPVAGWIYLHIEGKPYERGYQHGYLMAKEIPEYLERCARNLGGKAESQSWNQFRTTANALFLRGFDREILEEMRGVADGAGAAGAKWLDRKVDLIDIVVANTTVELGMLRGAMPVTPTGLEDTRFEAPPYSKPRPDSVMDHCSAFAATGPATRDGKMIIGHVTWWSQTLAEQTNVMLDIQPERGRRVLMQSYPGGIESGTDWYQNDAGVVLTETTIRQTPFNAQGTPVAFRARRAIQYGGSIDEVVKELGQRNNGLYTNEWLIADAKTNEIAMYELGTYHTRLWRSSRNEWFGNTPGFYWGNNNAKDLAVNLEYHPDPRGDPAYIPYTPAIRDLAWQKLYADHRGRIDEQFGFLAFRSAPLVSASTMDAKIATSDMASHFMVWAAIGRPNQSAWTAREASNRGMFPGGYVLLGGEPGQSPRAGVEPAKAAEPRPAGGARRTDYADRLWKGWILPASDADDWFVAGSARYHGILRSGEVDRMMERVRVSYRGLKLSPDNAGVRIRREEAKGALFLDGLRRKTGDDAFLKLMSGYFAANTTKTVTAQSFLDAAGVSFDFSEPGDGPAYLPGDIERRLGNALIVYGTLAEAGANRYAAEQLQLRFRDTAQTEVGIRKDFEVTDEALRRRDVIFVGRPATNTALAAWSDRIGLDYPGALFRADGRTYASERNALILAAKNPLDAGHMVLLYAGNSPLATAESIRAEGDDPAVILEDGKSVQGPTERARGRRGR